MSEPKVIKIDEVEYVRKDSLPVPVGLADNAFVVRTQSAGVFAGRILSRNGSEVEMENARRLWYWSGASSLSQLAMEGVTRPKDCKFPCCVARVTLLGVVEIIQMSKRAVVSINAVPEWRQ